MNTIKTVLLKKIALIMAVMFVISSCTESDFEDSYADPSKISTSSVDKQFVGFLQANREYVIPSYWNYFVVLRTTVNRYTQAVGWVNAPAQYVPGGGLITNRWDTYYLFLAQYRELEKIYSGLTPEDQTARRIFMIAATIYLYDHTQKVVDLHGDIPFSDAGMLSANGGDYGASMPKYDGAAELYTKMLDDLAAFATELNSINVAPAILTGFKNQDVINNGDMNLWRAYCNSLRLRMLTRVSAVSAFQARATSEIQTILADPTNFPVVSGNAGNIQIEVFNLDTPFNSTGFRTGLEDWNGNTAGKAMIDHMLTASDPRLRVMYEPGANAAGLYLGIDPLQASSAQQSLVDGGTVTIYNRSTLSRNQFFPGVLVNAAEVSLLAAEYYLKTGKDAEAKTAYNKAIEQSIEEYYMFRSVSNDNVAGSVDEPEAPEIAAYRDQPTVSWDDAASHEDKLKLIATQKWIHFSVVQPIEGWSELRRLDFPKFNFETDNSNAQKEPPVRWLYATSENVYNTENYNAVRANDNLKSKLFWDVN